MGDRSLWYGAEAADVARFAAGLGLPFFDEGADLAPMLSEPLRRRGPVPSAGDVGFDSLVERLQTVAAAVPPGSGWVDSAAGAVLAAWRAAAPDAAVVACGDPRRRGERLPAGAAHLRVVDVRRDPLAAARTLADHGVVPPVPVGVHGLAVAVTAAARLDDGRAVARSAAPESADDGAWRLASQLRPMGPPSGAGAAVTVVIPCRDDGSYLVEAVASVLAAGPGHPALIVVDDESTDPTTLLVLDALHGAGHPVLRSEGGLGAARNAGFAAATTPFVLPLDADDLLRPRHLELLDHFDDGVDVVHTDAEWFGRRRGRRVVPAVDKAAMVASNHVPVTALIRRHAWEAVGGYSTDLSRYHDWDFWLSLLDRGSGFVHVDDIGFDVRERADSLSDRSSKDVAQLEAAFAAVHARHPALVAEHLHSIAATLMRTVIELGMQVRDRDSAVDHLQRDIRIAEVLLEDLRRDLEDTAVELADARRAARNADELRRHVERLREALQASGSPDAAGTGDAPTRWRPAGRIARVARRLLG